MLNKEELVEKIASADRALKAWLKYIDEDWQDSLFLSDGNLNLFALKKIRDYDIEDFDYDALTHIEWCAFERERLSNELKKSEA